MQNLSLMKFVWDTSAIINIKEPNHQGYSPGYSLIKDLSDGWIIGPYLNIFPAISIFEVEATVSRMHRDGKKLLRRFYIFDDNSMMYPVDESLISRCYELFVKPGFDRLTGADLVFACIAYLESAILVTRDKKIVEHMNGHLKVIDLNESMDSATYRSLFAGRMTQVP